MSFIRESFYHVDKNLMETLKIILSLYQITLVGGNDFLSLLACGVSCFPA